MLRHIRLVSGRIVELSGKNDALLIGGDETKRHILKFEITTQTFEVMNMSLLLSQGEDRSCI